LSACTPEVSASAPETPAPSLSELVAERQLARDRFDIKALVAKADHRFLGGEHRTAASFYAFAVKCAEARGVPDDRVRRMAERARDMRDWLAQRFRHHVLSELEAAGFPERDWPPRFRTALEILHGERERDLVYEDFPQMPRLFFYPGLPYVDFVDPAQFAWRAGLESRFREIRDEAAALVAETSDFSPYVTRTSDKPHGDVHGLLENADWSSLYLWTNGGPVEENVARCPRMFEAVTGLVPLCRIGSKAPAILLSLLKPGAHIPPHTGMLNIRYICHLPLIVPPDCTLRVGQRTTQWQEGRIVAFDDTVEHEAWNRSDRDRLVLIFDVWNPDLADDEKRIVARMLEIVDSYR
jgi:aspartyl/asparaginyl beta-hydroxylase (cupin superfamily)